MQGVENWKSWAVTSLRPVRSVFEVAVFVRGEMVEKQGKEKRGRMGKMEGRNDGMWMRESTRVNVSGSFIFLQLGFAMPS